MLIFYLQYIKKKKKKNIVQCFSFRVDLNQLKRWKKNTEAKILRVALVLLYESIVEDGLVPGGGGWTAVSCPSPPTSCPCARRSGPVTTSWLAGRRLLAALLLLLETEARPPAQLPLLLGEVVGPRGAGPGLQDVVHLRNEGPGCWGFFNVKYNVFIYRRQKYVCMYKYIYSY